MMERPDPPMADAPLRPGGAPPAPEPCPSEIQQLIALAPVLLATRPPLTALRLWLPRLAHCGRFEHGPVEPPYAVVTDGVADKAYAPMVGAVALLLQACENASSIGHGVDAEDVLLLMGFLWQTPPGPQGEARAERLIDLVPDGLTATAEFSSLEQRR